MAEENGRIKLTWHQFVWGATVLLFMGGQLFTLYRLSSDVTELKLQLQQSVYSKQAIDLMREAANIERTRMWEAINSKRDK